MSNMKKLTRLLEKAENSGFYRWLLNRLLCYIIPFNAQHGIRITRLNKEMIESTIPYERRNMNHIKGVHACGLATIGEFSGGIMLLHAFDATKYRLIMSHLEVDYHYQAKRPILSRAKLLKAEQQTLLAKLEAGEVVMREMVSELYDDQENHVATVKTLWQLKPWSKVKTKL
jgi:acyl-coenzyme A thioesterase PaaI-like protein